MSKIQPVHPEALALLLFHWVVELRKNEQKQIPCDDTTRVLGQRGLSMAGVECSPPLCSPKKAEPPHSSPQWWNPTQAGPGCYPALSLPCGAAGAASMAMLLLSLHRFLLFFAQDFVFPVPYPGARQGLGSLGVPGF